MFKTKQLIMRGILFKFKTKQLIMRGILFYFESLQKMLNFVKTLVFTIKCFTNIRPTMPTKAVYLSKKERSIAYVRAVVLNQAKSN